MSRNSASHISMKRIGLQLSPGFGRLLAATLAVWLAAGSLASNAADRIILRSGGFITNKTVTSFDEDGVRLSDATVLPWHEIEKAKITAGKQAAFDKMHGELADDLFRIRQRLSVGDFAGLLPHAEAIQERYLDRTSDTAYMVLQSLMWGRLASGQREAAVAPYLRCYNLLRQRGTTRITLPGERRLEFEPKTAVTPELTPVWFDAAAAKAARAKVSKAIRAMNVNARPDGAYIYFATLAAACGDDAAAERALKAVREPEATISELRDIINAQREVVAKKPGPAMQRLQEGLANLTSDNKPLALYWIGRAKLLATEEDTQQEGLLDLLRIPPLHGDDKPELAAAALYEAMQRLNQKKELRGSVALRSELLAEYGNSYFARQINKRRAERQP
jgi:hypothetical protein